MESNTEKSNKYFLKLSRANHAIHCAKIQSQIGCFYQNGSPTFIFDEFTSEELKKAVRIRLNQLKEAQPAQPYRFGNEFFHWVSQDQKMIMVNFNGAVIDEFRPFRSKKEASALLLEIARPPGAKTITNN